MKLCTAAEMRAIDKRVTEVWGLPSLVLMENAGREAARRVEQFREGNRRPDGYFAVTVVCGPGNNGGDGLCAARFMAIRGMDVRVVLLANAARLQDDPRVQLSLLHRMEVPVVSATSAAEWQQALEMVFSADVVVDAIFGTGFRPPVQDSFLQTVIEDINRAPGEVLSIDLPSGLGADTGRVEGPAVSASATLWLGFPKYAHVFEPAATQCGELWPGELGVPAQAAIEAGVRTEWVVEDEVRQHFNQRRRDTHKGDYGHALIIGGSEGKAGAPLLSARAALRAGAGLVTLAVPQSLAVSLTGRFPEIMVEALPETPGRGIAEGALMRALDLARQKNFVALGPGMGTDESTQNFVESFVRQCPLPMALDADALNSLASGRMDALRERRAAEAVLTPHPGEMARLMQSERETILTAPVEAARKLASSANAIAVLKGYRSVTAMPDGFAYVNSSGNPGMATAGTGDALTGVIAALAAQSESFNVPTAAFLGVFVHGLAGDLASWKLGEQGLTASDLIDHLPQALRRLSGAPPEEERRMSHDDLD
jgi:NAD(P)H-hydrate epimerase